MNKENIMSQETIGLKIEGPRFEELQSRLDIAAKAEKLAQKVLVTAEASIVAAKAVKSEAFRAVIVAITTLSLARRELIAWELASTLRQDNKVEEKK
jgi:hypothetical protein